jgi:hypothetical protein
VCAEIARIRIGLLAEHIGLDRDEVADCFNKAGALIACIEQLRGQRRTRVPFVPERPNEIENAIACTEVLDPEAPNEIFEPRVRPGLLARLERSSR